MPYRPVPLSSLVLFVAATASAQTFAGLGTVPGAVDSFVSAVSGDGRVVVGSWRNEYGASSGFRWTLEGGMEDLGQCACWDYTVPDAVSTDGSVIVGNFRWANGAMDYWITDFGEAFGVSGDGAVMVGNTDALQSNYRAFWWTRSSGFTNIPPLAGADSSRARGVSANGHVAVGYCTYAAADRTVAFRSIDGGPMLDLGALPGGNSAVAYATNADGSVIVGYSGGGAAYVAFRWTPASGMTSLGLFPGLQYGEAYAVSGDGDIVAGTDWIDQTGHPWIWTAHLGKIDIEAYLSSVGLYPDDWAGLG
jgi:probable HAF family extracellular repeat protein